MQVSARIAIFASIIVLVTIVSGEFQKKPCTGSKCTVKPREQPKPSKGQPKPTPGEQKPTPRHQKPTPGQPKPTPGQRKPTPGGPKPSIRWPEPSRRKPKPTPSYHKPTAKRPKPTPGQQRPDQPIWTFEKPSDMLDFLRVYYQQFLDISRLSKMLADEAKSKGHSWEDIKTELSKNIHEMFETMLKGVKHLKNTKISMKELAKIRSNKQEEFQMFQKMVFAKLKGEPSSPWEKLILGKNFKSKNKTLFHKFIRENNKNVSRVFFTIFHWWVKARSDARVGIIGHIKDHVMNIKRPCPRDCMKLKEVFSFCKSRRMECSNNKNGDKSKGKYQASVRKPHPTEGLPSNCEKGKRRCPLKQQCVPKDKPCIDDRDIFDDVKEALDALSGKRHGADKAGESHVTPKIRPSMVPKEYSEGEKKFLRNAGYSVGDILRLKPSVVPDLLSKLKGQLSEGLRKLKQAISPTKSKESVHILPHNCSQLCPERNASFCWTEMRCKKREMKCGMKHLIRIMNSSKIEDGQTCESGEFSCPILGKCTDTKAECTPEQFTKPCLKNTTCWRKGPLRRLNISELEEEDRTFRLKCPKGEKFCPGRSGCVGRNESCSDSKKLRFPPAKGIENERKIYCRLSDYICPRLYTYWKVMHVGCKNATKDWRHPNGNKTLHTHVRPDRKSVRPHPTMIRPSRSRPHDKPDKPRTRAGEGSRLPPIKSIAPSVLPPKPLPLIMLNPRLQIADLLKPRHVDFVAVAAVSKAPLVWKCTVPGAWWGREVVKRVTIPFFSKGGKWVILPKNCKLSFTTTSASYHGAVLLKYHPIRDRRHVSYSLSRIQNEALVGDLVVVIYPVLPQCKMRFIGKSHVHMFENEKEPPIIKLQELVNVTSSPVVRKSGISSQLASKISKAILARYNQQLELIRTAACQIAVLEYEGSNSRYPPGKWIFKSGKNPWKPFPARLNKYKPLMLLPTDLVKFSPRLNFNGILKLIMIPVPKVTGPSKAKEEAEDVKKALDMKAAVLELFITVRGRPILTSYDICFPPLPFKLTTGTNLGYQVSDLISKGKRSCSDGKEQSSKPLVVYDNGVKPTKIAMAIVETPNRESDGKWQIKNSKGIWKEVRMESKKKEPTLCVLVAPDSRIRWLPKNNATIWATIYALKNIWVKFHVVTITANTRFGACNISRESVLFSRKPAQISLQRKGCDGKVGLFTVKDNCGKCKTSSGKCGKEEEVVPPKRVCPKKDCFNRCYSGADSTSQNVLDSCGKCQLRKDFVNPKDCNGDCISRRYGRACINKCGVCVGGKTKKPLDYGINACGTCKSQSKSVCSKKMTLTSGNDVEANEEFEISVKAEGFSSLRYVTCSVYGPNSQSLAKNLGRRSVRKSISAVAANRNASLCEDTAESWYLIRYNDVTLEKAGEYQLKCTVDKTVFTVGGKKLRAISTAIVVKGYRPQFVQIGRKNTVIVKGTGFTNTSGLSCIAVNEDHFYTAKIKGVFLNESAISCQLPSLRLPGRLVLLILSSSAVKRPATSKSWPRLEVICPYPRAVRGEFTRGLRQFRIQLDRHAVYSPTKQMRYFACGTVFDKKTVSKLGKSRCSLLGNRIYVSLPVNSKIFQGANVSIKVGVSSEHLRCRWTKFSKPIGALLQTVEIKLPKIDIKAVIHGESNIDSCDRIILSGSKSKFGDGGKRIYRWKLLQDGTAIERKEGFSFFKVLGSKLKTGKDYKVSLCVSNILNQENCADHKLAFTSSQAAKIQLSIQGPSTVEIKASEWHVIKPKIKFIQCGKRKKLSEMKFIWEIVPNVEGKVSKKNKFLVIRPGSLKSQTNYTFNLLVRAIEENVETATASVNIHVGEQPLRAKIRGGQEMTVGCYETIRLDGGQSRDPDRSKAEAVYTWDCLDKVGKPCMNSSNPDQRLIIEEKKRIRLNVRDNLECNQSYVFNLTFSKDSRSDTASIRVNTKPGYPAEVKLDQVMRGNMMIISGFIKTKSSAVVDWSSAEEEGFEKLDFDDRTLVRRARKTKEIKVKSRAALRRQNLIIFRDKLPPNTKYKLLLNVKNNAGSSKAAVLVESVSRPEKGDVKVSPLNGTALNTSFAISADEGWDDADSKLNYEFGYEEKGSRGVKEVILKPYSEQNYIESMQLPPGSAEKGWDFEMYVKVKNKYNLWTKAKTVVKVQKSEDIGSEKVKEVMSESNQAIIRHDYEKANQMIATVLKSGGDDKVVDGVSVKDDLTKQALTILEKTSSADTKMTISTLELTTKPGLNGNQLKPETRAKVAKTTKDAILGTPFSSASQNSKRKRRSAEPDSSSSFTPKSKEEVDSVMTVFDNIIDENETGNSQNEEKADFTSTTPSLLRSLCSGLIQTDDFTSAKNNLSTLRASRVAGDTFAVNSLNLSDASQGSTLVLGSYLQQKYEQWNCSDSGLPCTELCVGTTLYHHNLYRSEDTGRISDIVHIHLIHPDEDYSILDPGVLQSPVQLSMKLSEIPDANHTVQCKTWKSGNWTSEGCITKNEQQGFVICNCTSITNVTVFKISSPADLATPSTYHNTNVLSQVASTNASDLQGITPINVSPSTSATGQSSSTSSAATPPDADAIQVVFSFPVNYDDYASVGKAEQFKQDVINALATKLQISKNRIQNLEIKPGSIIVSFTLIGNNGNSNEDSLTVTKARLETMATAGTLNVTLSDGTVLTADPSSLKFSSPPATNQPPIKKPRSKKSLLLIVVVTVLVVILLTLLLARLLYVRRNRRTKIDPDRPTSARSLVVDAIQLEEKKKAEQQSKEPEAVRKTSGYENLVAVGIGSSVSLKKSPMPDC